MMLLPLFISDKAIIGGFLVFLSDSSGEDIANLNEMNIIIGADFVNLKQRRV